LDLDHAAGAFIRDTVALASPGEKTANLSMRRLRASLRRVTLLRRGVTVA
jgi:hypothetical protein